MVGRGMKKFGRRVKNTVRRARKIVGGGARTVQTILGKADKLSGGMATSLLNADPRTRAALMAVNVAAGAKHGRKMQDQRAHAAGYTGRATKSTAMSTY